MVTRLSQDELRDVVTQMVVHTHAVRGMTGLDQLEKSLPQIVTFLSKAHDIVYDVQAKILTEAAQSAHFPKRS
ncbi:MAG TPA: hypothetical protein VFL28_16900 [bacterium]|nr:hypothetical protein [bacterium]